MVKDLLKQLQGQDSGQWANNKVSGLDRTLGEISRILEKQVQQKNANESKIFSSCTDPLIKLLLCTYTLFLNAIVSNCLNFIRHLS